MSLVIPKLKKREPLDRVAFFGPMCSGKSFLANILIHHQDYTKVALADKLKSLVYDLYGVQGKDGEARKILQEFADDVKKWDSEVFIKHFFLKIQHIEDVRYPQKIVCDDLRFLNEAKHLKKAGFTLIRVNCDETERISRIQKLYPNTADSALSHKSEMEYLEIPADYEIDSTNLGAVTSLLRLIYGSFENSTSGETLVGAEGSSTLS